MHSAFFVIQVVYIGGLTSTPRTFPPCLPEQHSQQVQVPTPGPAERDCVPVPACCGGYVQGRLRRLLVSAGGGVPCGAWLCHERPARAMGAGLPPIPGVWDRAEQYFGYVLSALAPMPVPLPLPRPPKDASLPYAGLSLLWQRVTTPPPPPGSASIRRLTWCAPC